MKILTVACCLATLVLAGCRSAIPKPDVDALLGVDWLLSSMRSGEESTAVAPGAQPPTLRFDSGSEGVAVAGFSGVNRFTGTCTLLEEGGLRFSPLATTRMAGPPEAMELERSFLAQLQAARSFAVAGARLMILTRTGSLEFRSE
jgi:heat shock protein HslJ